jgi:hypothetical protein
VHIHTVEKLKSSNGRPYAKVRATWDGNHEEVAYVFDRDMIGKLADNIDIDADVQYQPNGFVHLKRPVDAGQPSRQPQGYRQRQMLVVDRSLIRALALLAAAEACAPHKTKPGDVVEVADFYVSWIMEEKDDNGTGGEAE